MLLFVLPGLAIGCIGIFDTSASKRLPLLEARRWYVDRCAKSSTLLVLGCALLDRRDNLHIEGDAIEFLKRWYRFQILQSVAKQ